ncbi:hypothetical protein AMELA_G00092100 [Ameiurus melas]|uniref:Uncharacterized protein n=1 Tax=Ameiurus melas TaxID=219545 RepID=A0A7J6AYZ9_AMEME|nr:hypothetical protein AMELA_G00092100 [Ameiurus melas]
MALASCRIKGFEDQRLCVTVVTADTASYGKLGGPSTSRFKCRKPYMVSKRRWMKKNEVYHGMSCLCSTEKENRQNYFISSALVQAV